MRLVVPPPPPLANAVGLVFFLLTTWSPCCHAQFPSSSGLNLTTFRPPSNPNITVSYKVPDGVCTTAFADQQQYTGWVNVPGDYPANIFFWFVAARQPTSVLTVWLSGGPGTSSMFGFFSESGPCEVVEAGADRLETVARDWGWDRASNMLFIDQVRRQTPSGKRHNVHADGTCQSQTKSVSHTMYPPTVL